VCQVTASLNSARKRRREVNVEKIDISHGGGGKAMRDLIALFVETFDNTEVESLEDQARIPLSEFILRGDRLAFTTDSYVVNPIFFPGGDIGKLAVCGTVNDLAVGGAVPLYLTCSFILEEGLAVSDLREIVASMKAAADTAGVKIVTGDTKVVERGAADKIFINTAGVGAIPKKLNIGANRLLPGDLVLVNGTIGDHGAAIISARGDLAVENEIASDCAPLNKLIENIAAAVPDLRCVRDATRGGIASVLNEFAESSNVCIRIRERDIPVRQDVRGVCEILGLDPLYLANEGKVVFAVPAKDREAALKAMAGSDFGGEGRVIGEVVAKPACTVILETSFGGERILDMLVGDQLPRIC
jgi:hydrogenase expression/formation protein HypE